MAAIALAPVGAALCTGPQAAACGLVALLALGIGALIVQSADDDAEETLSSAQTGDEVCSTCGDPEEDPPDDEPTEQDAKDAKRMKTNKLEEAARNNGYDNAHSMKDDLGLDSRYDIFVDRQGRMYAGPRQGSGTPQYLHMNVRGF